MKAAKYLNNLTTFNHSTKRFIMFEIFSFIIY